MKNDPFPQMILMSVQQNKKNHKDQAIDCAHVFTLGFGSTKMWTTTCNVINAFFLIHILTSIVTAKEENITET